MARSPARSRLRSALSGLPGASHVPGLGGTPAPPPLVLELDLARGVVEAPPTSPVQALRTRHQSTLAGVVAGLEEVAERGPSAGVAALVCHLGAWQPSLAQSAELRAAVARVRAAGVRTLVWTESFGEVGAGNTAYHLASAFDEIWLQPTGDLGLVGLAVRTTHARQALDRLGVLPQVAHRHEYKSAPNVFLTDAMPAPQREMLQAILDSATSTLVSDVAHDRGLDVAAVRAAVEAAPLTAPDALAAGLVDRLGYRDEVYAAVRAAAAGPAGDPDGVRLRYLARWRDGGTLGGLGGLLPGQDDLRRQLAAALPGAGSGPRPVVAVVHATGPITVGAGGGSPFSGPSVGSDSLGALLRQAGRDPAVRAVVLRIDSPGGSYVASDALRRQVLALREAGTPVVASMGTVAGSGGYFLAMPCDRVLASAGTLTGSIGVFAGKQVLRDALAKVGVHREAVTSGPWADMFSPDRPFTDEEWARLEGWLDRVYADFTTKAAADRGMPLADLEAVARGRVWTGADALERGLVDQLGGLSDALDVACGLAEVARADAVVRTLPKVGALAALRAPESSESPAAALAAPAAGGIFAADGVPSLDRLLGVGLTAGLAGVGLAGLPGVGAHGVLSMPDVRLG